MKKVLLLILALCFLLGSNILPQRKLSGFKSSYKLKSNFNYKAPKIKSPAIYKPPSNKIGGTKYKYGATYKSSGLPKVERSNTIKREFLKSKGYKKEPEGYEVDHIIPLSQGGQDVPKRFINKKPLMKEKRNNKY